MNLEEARRVIASYLAGRRIAAGELESARRTLFEDAAYVRELRGELGISAESSECQIFSANVAEFCEMSEAQRQTEAPELLQHIENCSSCRFLLWQIQPPWKATVERARSLGTSFARVLAAPIRLALGVAGDLLEQGIGPPSLKLQQVATTAHVPVEGARKEWAFTDEEAGQIVHLRVEGRSSQEASVNVSLEKQQAGIRIEVRARDGALIVSGPLEDIQVEPLRLGPGHWTLRVSDPGPVMRTWEIPLEIETGPTYPEEADE
jgi:hypothetical protein